MSRAAPFASVSLAIAMFALTACGDGNDTADAPEAEAAPPAGAAAEVEAPAPAAAADLGQEIQAGMWEHTSTVTSAAIPGAPAEMAAAMVGQASTTSSCITAEQLAAGPDALFNQSNGQCVYDTFSMSGGAMDVAGTCTVAGAPGPMRLTAMGTYTQTTYAATTALTLTTPGGEVRIETEGGGQRTGDC